MEIFKIDLDIKIKRKAITQIKERLIFLRKIKIIDFKQIEKIELIKKNSYSCKIYYKKDLIDKKDIIIIQAILGDDYKRLGITFRDYLLNIENFNRLFDIKRYISGEFKKARIIDITKDILDKK